MLVFSGDNTQHDSKQPWFDLGPRTAKKGSGEPVTAVASVTAKFYLQVIVQ